MGQTMVMMMMIYGNCLGLSTLYSIVRRGMAFGIDLYTAHHIGTERSPIDRLAMTRRIRVMVRGGEAAAHQIGLIQSGIHAGIIYSSAHGLALPCSSSLFHPRL